MSNEPGGPAPVPDPYAVPEPAPTVPLPVSGHEAVAPSGYEAVAPSGYEAVRTPVTETGPTAPSGAPTTPYGPPSESPTVPLPSGSPTPPTPYGAPAAPTPYGQHPAAGPAASPHYGAVQPPQYGVPQYGAPQPQYGAPQYGPAGYDQTPPPYGAQPYGYGQPYAAPPTDGMAIASFVTSTAGLLFFAGIPGAVGLGLGIAALRRIKVSGKSGRGWAIAGIAVGGFGILVTLAVGAYVAAVLMFLGSAMNSTSFIEELEQGYEQGDEEGSTEGGTDLGSGDEIPDFSLRTDLGQGTCLTTQPLQYDMADTDPVGCDVPHDAEVVGVIPMSGPVPQDLDAYDPAYDDAWAQCDTLTEQLVPDYFSDGTIELFYPHPDDYASGITSAYCVFSGDEPGMTGSAVARTLVLVGSGA